MFRSLSPFETYSSRRHTILVFHDRGGEEGVEALSVGRFNYQGLYTVVPTHNDEQFEGLRALVEERDPARIGINGSERWNHADGLTATQPRSQKDVSRGAHGFKVAMDVVSVRYGG